MTVDQYGNVYLEAFREPSSETGYSIIPVIQEVNDAEHTAITYVEEENDSYWSEWDEESQTSIRHDYKYILRNTFYYDKF